MRWIIVILACCGLAAAGCQTVNQKQIKEAEAHRELGEAFLYEDNYAAALRELTAAQKKNPSDPLVYNDIGLVYMSRNRPTEAQQYFSKALSLKPDYGDAKLNLAVAYLKNERWDEAIEHLHALESDMLYTSQQRAQLNLGYAYYMKSDYAAAAKYYGKVIQYYQDGFSKDITYIQGLLGQARVSLRTGKARQALNDLDTALSETPQIPELHFYRGQALEQLGDVTSARNAYLRVIELAPQGELAKKTVVALRNLAQ